MKGGLAVKGVRGYYTRISSCEEDIASSGDLFVMVGAYKCV